MKWLALLLIKIYQFTLSPILGNACRFYPSCSVYAYQAIERFGLMRGGWMGARRLLKCNPFFAGGYDPCPEKH
jgi:putative membrane protein insertion efficiency factor